MQQLLQCSDLSCCTAVITVLLHIPGCFARVSLLALCASARLLYGRAGVELGAEIAKGDPWPNPPQPCGIIAGTQSLALANPTSWLTSLFHMISGEQKWPCQMQRCMTIAGCVLQGQHGWTTSGQAKIWCAQTNAVHRSSIRSVS